MSPEEQKQAVPDIEPELTEAWPELPPVQQQHQMELFREPFIQRLLGWIFDLWEKRHPSARRWIVRLSGGAIVFGLIMWLIILWKFPNKDATVTNWLYYPCPILLSALFAFLPELAKVERMRPLIRIGVLAIGVGVSYLNYHHDQLSALSIQKAIDAALNTASAHAETDIETVRRDLKQDVGVVQKQVSALAVDAASTKGETSARFDSLGKQLTGATDSITKSIGGIALPPDKVATIVFSLWSEKLVGDPVSSITLAPDEKGVFTVPWVIINTSAVAVKQGDAWISVCRACEFAEEPANFEKLGTDDTTRHRMIFLNPGVTMDKQVIRVRVKEKSNLFVVAFQYSCDVCGDLSKRSNQVATIHIAE